MKEVVKVNEVSFDIEARMLEIKDNLESLDGFNLPRVKMTADGFELIEGEKPATSLEGVILHTRKINVYYANAYNPNAITAPDCISSDGVKPDASVASPVHSTCKGCPMAEYGSNQMKTGKACRNLKPLFMLLSDDSIMPKQIVITPASLKAANQYLMDLTERGLSYRRVKTLITAYKKNPRDTYMTLKFNQASRVSDQQQKNVEFLKTQWLPVMNAQSEFEIKEADEY